MRCLILSRSVMARLLASRSVPAIPQTPPAHQLGRARRVLDVPVPEIVLQRAGIAPVAAVATTHTSRPRADGETALLPGDVAI